MVDGEVGWDVTLASVRQQFNAVENPTDIVVKINSVGGDVDEGFAIHDFLRAQGLPVTTIGEGRVYSIATVILLAGDEGKRQMSPNSQFMVHNPWGSPQGDARHIRHYADELERRESQLADFYATKTGQPLSDIQEWMNNETYLSASDTVALGFADSVYEVIRVAAMEPIKAVAKFKVNNSKEDMSEITKEDRTLIQDFVASVKAIMQPKPKAEAQPEVTEPEPEKVDETEKPDLDAQFEEMKARIEALEAEKKDAQEKLSEAEKVNEENEGKLEAVLAKVKEMEALPIAKAEKPAITTDKTEKTVSPFDGLAAFIVQNRKG